MNTTCHLCACDAPLCESHIIPKFVYDWLKDTSVSGRIRSAAEPNIPVQDGIKEHMFCRACEERFQTWEKACREQLFDPFHNGNLGVCHYDEWLWLFSLSVLWRSLRRRLYFDPNDDIQPETKTRLTATESTWRKTLLSGSTKRVPEQHILLLHPVTPESGQLPDHAPPNLNQYLLRYTDTEWGIIRGQPLFIYAKLCRLVLVAMIDGSWDENGTLIEPEQGCLPTVQVVPALFTDFLFARARGMYEAQHRISPRQWDRTHRACQKRSSEQARHALEALKADVHIFGLDRVFSAQDQAKKQTSNNHKRAVSKHKKPSTGDSFEIP